MLFVSGSPSSQNYHNSTTKEPHIEHNSVKTEFYTVAIKRKQRRDRIKRFLKYRRRFYL